MMLNIDIIEHCNFKCYFCDASKLQNRRFMDVDLFIRIVTEAAELGITELVLTPPLGEAFLHPAIYDMLEYALPMMKKIIIVSNGSAINVDKLSRLDTTKLTLRVSQYGSNAAEFVSMTKTSQHMFDVVAANLTKLTQHGIKYQICERPIDYDFRYSDDTYTTPLHDAKVKCKYHRMPRIFPNGDVSFCRIISMHANPSASVFANLSEVSLKQALTDPIRYKFYDSQSVCTTICTSSHLNCGDAPFNTYKLLNLSKQQYIQDKDRVDRQYVTIEHKCIQSCQSQTDNRS